MDDKNISFSNLTSDEEQKLKKFEKEFISETGKNLYLLAFDKR